MPNKHLQRARVFAFVLYPDEDKLHKFIFDYYTTRESCVWITHDRDLWTENDFLLDKCSQEDVGTLKKKHVHLMIRFQNPRSVSQFQKDCTFTTGYSVSDDEPDKVVNENKTVYFEVVSSYEAMLRYFIHDTIQCVYDGKTRYNVSDLHGDRDLIYNALNYEYPLDIDVFSCFLDTILSNNMPYHVFVQYVVANFQSDSLEFKTFQKYKWDFTRICDSLMRWSNYNNVSSFKKNKIIESIKSEYQLS